MQNLQARLRAIRPGRLVGSTALLVVWGVLLLGVAVPSWRDVRQNHQEIEALETELADLDRWIVAGLWLEPAVEAREPRVMAAWERIFPSSRDREALFLDVARVADRAGVREFQLEEVEEMGTFDMGTWSTTGDAAMAPPSDDAPPSTDDAPPGDGYTPPPVAITLRPYVVRATFVSDYAAAAAFLGGLENIDRSLDVRQLAIRPARQGVTVELELEVPVSEPLAS